MNTFLRPIIALLFVLAVSFTTHAHASWLARVVTVTDGDTIVVEPVKGGDRVKIRLWGIDAPEIKQPGGKAAKDHCARVALWQTVRIKEIDMDRYQRVLAVVTRQGNHGKRDWSINGNMVLMGHAWSWRSPRWKKVMHRAQAKKVGLWKDTNPIPPWEWRKGKR